MKISEEIIVLYQKIKTIYEQKQIDSEEEEKIEVNEITGQVSAFYEKLRNSVDFKEVHLLRRFAIERNLKRRLLLETLKPNIARSLIEDMIRSRYLKNNTVPDNKVHLLERVIAKYNKLYTILNNIYHGKERQNYFNWLVGIEACEIDMLFNPENIEDSVVEAMYQVTKTRIKFKGAEVDIREKDIQLYISIHKSLVKSDDPIISYHLLNLYFPYWHNSDDSLIKMLGSNFPSIYNTIQNHLRHPYQQKLFNSLKEPVITFKILYELILVKGLELEELLANPELLEAEAKILLNNKYKLIRKKITASSMRAIVYIFLTKVILAIILEIPYELYILKGVNYINLIINIVFPPILMFIIALTIIPPSKENTKKILENLHDLIYNKKEDSILCKLKAKYRSGLGFKIFYNILYTALYIFVFGAVIKLLQSLEFNIVSGGLFILFLTAVSFFASRIRNTAKEYKAVQKKEGPFSFLINFFSLPIVAVGHWLSIKFKKINIFTFIMDFIIEAPFKMFIAGFEDWLDFMKEKKEDIYRNE
tara:strand:+ start:453 stop:2054 length:1602 start_codon:yes stop_codon:yes gene_type:complete